MTARQTPWPRAWLMTDERMGECLWEAIDRLPARNAGIVFRHYAIQADARADLGQRIADICRRRSLVLAIAADENLARTLGADLIHNPPEPLIDLPFSRSVHSLVEAEGAKADGVALVFVSPVYPTSSHPDRGSLGLALASRIATAAGVPAIALGGMTERKFPLLESEGFYGWAGIDAWLGEEGA